MGASQQGEYVSIGFHTNININRVIVEKLGHPYSTCIKNTNDVDSFHSDLYKYKYLQYKQDYLDLKDGLDGGRSKISSYALIYIILDVDSYNLMTTIIRRTILSINFIDSILTGSAFKIVEGSNKINFLSH
jgi:hypothetical protein